MRSVRCQTMGYWVTNSSNCAYEDLNEIFNSVIHRNSNTALHCNCRITIPPFNFGTARVQKYSWDELKYPISNDGAVEIKIFWVQCPLWCKYSLFGACQARALPQYSGCKLRSRKPWCRVVVETSSTRRTVLWCLLQVFYVHDTALPNAPINPKGEVKAWL